MPISRCWQCVAVGLLACGCGPSAKDDTGSGGGSTTAADDSDSTGTAENSETAQTEMGSSETGADPPSCATLAVDDCAQQPGCQTVQGSEAMPDGDPGDYSCSDLGLGFACVDEDCTPVAGVVCPSNGEGPARLVIDQCIPQGWELCGECILFGPE